jgi:hypothetical protein
LKPSQQLGRILHLNEEVKEALAAKMEGELIAKFKSLLSSSIKSGRYSNMDPVMNLYLGQSFLSVGNIDEATPHIRASRNNELPYGLLRESLVTLGICLLGGVADHMAIDFIESRDKLDEILVIFLEARAIKTDKTTYFHKSDEEIDDLISMIQSRILKIETLGKLKAEIQRKKLEERNMMLQRKADEEKRVQNIQGAMTQSAKLKSPVTLNPILPVLIQPFLDTVGGNPMHKAACSNLIAEVMSLYESGMDVSEVDDLGNTPLLCATENGCDETIRFLMKLSPWHTVNKAGKSFLDILLDSPIQEVLPILAGDVEGMAQDFLGDESAVPSCRWAAAKYFNKVQSKPLDKMMDMTGLASVKKKALNLFDTVRKDLGRPEKARLLNKQALNFLFLGNPGIIFIILCICLT